MRRKANSESKEVVVDTTSSTKTILVESKSYREIPFNFIIIYKKKGIFSEMCKEAVTQYPELMGLVMDGEDVNNCTAFVYSVGGANVFMFINDSLTLDVLVHECTHVTAAVFRRINSPINDCTEEFYAYITESIFRDAYSIITQQFKLKMKTSFY